MTSLCKHSVAEPDLWPDGVSASCAKSMALSEVRLRSKPELLVMTSLTSRFTLAPAHHALSVRIMELET